MCTSLNQSMRIAFLLTAIDAALVLFPVTAHAGSGFRRAIDAGAAGAKKVAVLVNIDKTNQIMTVSFDGVETYQWRVSTGRAGYSTPSGTYTATSMNKIWYSKQWDNAPMPHSIFFMKDGHAIHGSFDVKNLGQPVSHGCVRISPKNAATLYALVKQNGLENTQVVVTGDSPGGAHLAFLITMDPRVTIDRHGPIHLGEGQAVALMGEDRANCSECIAEGIGGPRPR
jgi:L,D-transpeptidase catalytic domain